MGKNGCSQTTRNIHPATEYGRQKWEWHFCQLLNQIHVWFLFCLLFSAFDSGCQNRGWVCSRENSWSSQHSIIRGFVDLCYARWWMLKEYQNTIQYPLPCISGWVCFFSSGEEVHRDIWDRQAWHGRPNYNFLQGDGLVITFHDFVPFSCRWGAGLPRWGTS